MKWKLSSLINRTKAIAEDEYECHFSYCGCSLFARLRIEENLFYIWNGRDFNTLPHLLFSRFCSDKLILRCMVSGFMEWIESEKVSMKYLK